MQLKISLIFDDTRHVHFREIAHVFQEEFGRPPSGPDGVFAESEEAAIANASVARVHRARLRGSRWKTWVLAGRQSSEACHSKANGTRPRCISCL
ncbi:hypothetical protein F5148DRAFT_1156384 [Russula earlei]|uniref:Uncharacterized protein n=1 Tax=Russula earlei TaxID=71964 RepID=A0ACC0UPE0_9AGAM|nr:hypothetical protein F5148DRAFT_1156384 [Russula earlei]